MSKRSAGLLMYRLRDGNLHFLLVHPGGPLWAKKDQGAWSIPKGLYGPEEDALTAAKREFKEETGFEPKGNFIRLSPIKQPSGKIVSAWAVEGDFDPMELKSNTFSMEWPLRSGKQQEFPEVDRAEWFDVEEAKRKILLGQIGFLIELSQMLGRSPALARQKIEVIAYSGYIGEESPRALIINGERVEVVEILDRRKEQRVGERGVKRYFKVKGSDGRAYTLCLDEEKKEWTCGMDG